MIVHVPRQIGATATATAPGRSRTLDAQKASATATSDGEKNLLWGVALIALAVGFYALAQK